MSINGYPAMCFSRNMPSLAGQRAYLPLLAVRRKHKCNTMLPRLSGATRIHLIVGDPIDQAKSPAGLTRVFAERGADAVCIPMQVPAPDFDAFLAAAKRVQNIDGIVITVPHKFSATRHCETLSARAHKLAAVNVMRRETDGRGSGDMADGIALVAALRARGFEPKGRRALVVGAGGAGSAVALALAEAGGALGLSQGGPEGRHRVRPRVGGGGQRGRRRIGGGSGARRGGRVAGHIRGRSGAARRLAAKAGGRRRRLRRP